jgi:hypothetical protein
MLHGESNFSIATAREINAGLAPGRIITRDGYPVRIICWDALGQFPIVGLVDYDTYERAEHYTNDGKSDIRGNVTSNYDLMIVK